MVVVNGCAVSVWNMSLNLVSAKALLAAVERSSKESLAGREAHLFFPE